MATISKNRPYHWEIQFQDLHRRRKTITLPKSKYTEKTANALKDVIETLLFKANNSDETLDKRTLTWIETAPPDIQQKLIKRGLIEGLPQRRTCKELWDAFLQDREKQVAEGTAEDSTLEADLRIRRRFSVFFDERTMLSELTKERMLEWKLELRKTYAEATIKGTLVKTRTAFNWAIRNGWLAVSPLRGVPTGSYENEDNNRDITIDEYHRLLNVCPCYDWTTIIALARIGGLRPCEVLHLKWSDVKWNENALLVFSPKMKRYPKKAIRQVPLFPALREILENHPNRNDSGSGFVISRYGGRKTNLVTQYRRIEKRAGLEEIPRPFDNMRASRSMEIDAEFGPFYESQWLGHSQQVAEKSYRHYRSADFQRATADPTGMRKPDETGGTEDRKNDQADEV